MLPSQLVQRRQVADGYGNVAASKGFFFFFAADMRRCAVVSCLPRGRSALPQRRSFATDKPADKAAFDAKRVSKSKAKTDAVGISEYQRVAKLVKPEQFKVQRSPDEVAYATALGHIFNRNHQAEVWRLQRALQRAIRCRQAAIAALPTEALRAAAKVVDDEWYADQLAGPNRLLTDTPPLPGYAALIPDEEEVIKESAENSEENEQQQ